MPLWAVANSSLMLGTDLTGMDPGDLAMLKNDEVIGVNQAGRAAHPVDRLTRQQTWVAPNPDGTYTVALFNLDVTGASTADNGGLVRAAANGATDQQWQLVPTGDGYFKLDNVKSGRLANIPGPTTVSGTRLIQYHDDFHNNAQWKVTPTGNGSYNLTSRYDGRNIAVILPASWPSVGPPWVCRQHRCRGFVEARTEVGRESRAPAST